VSLHEHLTAQTGAVFSAVDAVIAGQIIDQIEETGYFAGSLLDIAQRLGVPMYEVERVLAVIQTFDPAGVGARSLSECLAIQAKEANRYDPAMARLISNLDYVAKGNLAALKRICGVDDEDLGDMIRELRAYDPKPGCRFSQEATGPAIVPDVFRRRARRWAWRSSSTARRSQLLVNRTYYTELHAAAGQAVQGWLSDACSANWLVKALESAGAHDHQGLDRDREAAGRLLPPRGRALRPLTLQTWRRRSDARITAAASLKHNIFLRPRPLRAQIFLHQRNPELRWRRRRFGRSGEEPHQGAHHGREPTGDPLGRSAGRIAQSQRLRHRPAHGRQIS
jgi:RNA polymerase sigma-54 factor